MIDPAQLALVFLLIFVINVIPAFMPPTWIVLVAARIQFNLDPVLLVAVGALAATAGRTVLALATERLGAEALPRVVRGNLSALGDLLDRRERWTALVAFLLTIAPVPSNELFIGAGLAHLQLRPIAAGFFLSRIASYGFALATSDNAGVALDNLFHQREVNPLNAVIAIGGAVLGIGAGFVPWTRVAAWARDLFGTKPDNP